MTAVRDSGNTVPSDPWAEQALINSTSAMACFGNISVKTPQPIKTWIDVIQALELK